MDLKIKHTAPGDLINQYLRIAIAENDGICASAAMKVLGLMFHITIDKSLLAANIGVRFCGMSGPVQCVLAGTAQFIAYTAGQQGFGQQEILRLCQAGQCRCEETIHAVPVENRQSEDFLADVLLCAFDFIQENPHILGLGEATVKPRQYYESIYTDREAMFKHSPYALEERLSAAVVKGEIEEALAALQVITDQGEKAVLARDPLRSSKNSIIGSIAFLARAAIQAGVSANEAFALSDALTWQVEEMTDREAVLAFEESVLVHFVDLVRQQLEESYSAPITKVMHYVENHLDTKILLNAAAAYAGIHPAYLSARFKQETGLPFSHYAAIRKIQESCYFVRYTDYPISEIAVLYGFSSQSYYITTFKKVMGLTPMEYKRRNLAD